MADWFATRWYASAENAVDDSKLPVCRVPYSVTVVTLQRSEVLGQLPVYIIGHKSLKPRNPINSVAAQMAADAVVCGTPLKYTFFVSMPL